MKRISLLLITAGLSLTLSAQKATSRIDRALTIYNDVLRQLDISYADTLNYEDLLNTSIHQMLRKTDPYTVYMPEDKTSDLKFMTTGKYGGIGAVIMQRTDDKGNTYVVVSNPYEGIPAQRNDVRAGDRILEVDGKNVSGKGTPEVSQLLRGTPHSTVTLRLKREGQDKPITRSFEREEIKISPVEYATALPSPKGEKPTGYVSFTEFTEGSADLFSETVDNMVKNKGIGSLVIDLRGNGGGIIDEAVKIVGLFVEKGTEVVSTKGKTPQSCRTYRTPIEPRWKEMPIAVIVDHNSASAAEIVAGSLQDLDRAVIIGTRTYGKGLVQSIRPIAHNGHLKVTTSKYYIPSGRCIQAIDYSKRRADGSVERVPDSLTHEFRTRLGRIVRDGGGIEPDILMEDSQKVDITYALYSKNLFFDYATRYRLLHDTIAPAAEYSVSDEDLEDFIGFLKEKQFSYETETGKYMKDLIDMARHEDLDSTLLADLKQLEERLTPPFEEVVRHKAAEVKNFMGQEIISRYYYNKGVVIYNLRTDKELERAVAELSKTEGESKE